MITRALLHVHTGNTEALEWYQHRGFQVRPTPFGHRKQLQRGSLRRHDGRKWGPHVCIAHSVLQPHYSRGHWRPLCNVCIITPLFAVVLKQL